MTIDTMYNGSLTSTFEVDGIDFHVDISSGKQRRPSEPNSFTIVKTQAMLNYYFSLAQRLQPKAVLELGIFQGGSFALLDRLFQPPTMIGVEIDPSFEAMEHYLAQQTERNVQIAFSTSQADEVAIPQLLKENFEDGIDLVIDDASHTYALTKRSIELVWPTLKVGGTYVIEDWAWSFTKPMQSPEHPWHAQPAMANLIVELVADVGSYRNIRSVSMDAERVMLVKGAESDSFLDAQRLRGRSLVHI